MQPGEFQIITSIFVSEYAWISHLWEHKENIRQGRSVNPKYFIYLH